jgi:dTDP-4-amino-4,6-dideoxygalactose transaminase
MSELKAVEEKVMQLPSDQDRTGRTLGAEEIAALAAAIDTGTLTSTKGRFVRGFETAFGARMGAKHSYACASGTAAVHLAVAALNPEPGDEIVTTAITDMGALTPILYQGAIPVFADVDARTGNLTAEAIEARLSPRTKAVVVTHLFGNPCDMDPILDLGRRKGLPVVEDCAQAFGSTYGGRPVGTLGAIGTFSLQQGKHITTGEGGIVVTDDDAHGRHMYLYLNKAWGYGDPKPDHYFLALNYRLSELQGAVAGAQLPKLDGVVEARIRMAERLTEKLKAVPGIETPFAYPKSRHTYWKYSLMVDPGVIEGGPQAVAKILKEGEIASAPRYIQKPAFACEVFQKQRTLGNSRWPFTLARPEAVDYRPELFPGTFRCLERILVLPWTEKHTEEHVDYIAEKVKLAASRLRKGGAR